ncbi:MAG: hypothetical protein QXQ90_10120 [Desulfurococcaceae archaeon]
MLGVVIGYFVPFVANYAAFMAVTLFLASVAVYVRYVLITTLVAASPLLAVAYLHPGLRGMVKHLTTLLAGLMLAGPIAAVFLVVLSRVVPGQDVVFGILYPLIVGALPSILGVFGAGAVGGLASAVRGGVAALGGALGKALAQRGEAGAAGAGAQGASAVARLRAPAVTATPAKISAHPKLEAPVAQQAKIMKPAPIITPSMVKHARAEAEARREVFESVREMQELGPGVVAVTEGFDRAKQVEQEVKEELVHPRWESFKTFTREIASQSWRQLRTNLRSLKSEFYQGLKHIAERELGVKLPEEIVPSVKATKRARLTSPEGKVRTRSFIRDFTFH